MKKEKLYKNQYFYIGVIICLTLFIGLIVNIFIDNNESKTFADVQYAALKEPLSFEREPNKTKQNNNINFDYTTEKVVADTNITFSPKEINADDENNPAVASMQFLIILLLLFVAISGIVFIYLSRPKTSKYIIERR